MQLTRHVCGLPIRGAGPWVLLAAVAAAAFAAPPATAQAYDGPGPFGPAEVPAPYRLPGQWAYPPDEPEMQVIEPSFFPDVFSADRESGFPGREAALQQYLRRQLRYPSGAGPGRVLVQFTVEADGRISGARVVGRRHRRLDAEALRVIQAMPPWRPGWYNGRPATLSYTLPIVFRLTAAPAGSQP